MKGTDGLEWGQEWNEGTDCPAHGVDPCILYFLFLPEAGETEPESLPLTFFVSANLPRKCVLIYSRDPVISYVEIRAVRACPWDEGLCIQDCLCQSG